MTSPLRSCWVLLTMGDRQPELGLAIASIRAVDDMSSVLVVNNGGAPIDLGPEVTVVSTGENVGVPGGRDLGVRHAAADVVCFLDDDARLSEADVAAVLARFERDPHLGAISFRLVDESGRTARRHVPRFGRRGAARRGPVGTFLGGASAVRVEAYRSAGGYWPELWYGHEELDLAWRMQDRGWTVWYEPEIAVFHPATEISRHARGWELTGRNRVWIARRDLPGPVAAVHAFTWLVLGTLRAPGTARKRAYVGGWRDGWRGSVPRDPISWRTVWRLTRIGRPPLL